MTLNAPTPLAAHSPLEPVRTIIPPGSWHRPDTHYLEAMTSPWYSTLLTLQSTLTSATVEFWTARGLRFGCLPVTTNSISSPMGLGSDSLPVQVEMFGAATYLADSMQFGLEYLCRLSEHGAYYLMPSFRGEAPDDTHLCQFFHSEAEIRGGLDDVMAAAEAYLRHLAHVLMERDEAAITAAAGGVDHIRPLLNGSGPFRRLTFDEAAAELDENPQYVVKERGWRNLTRAGERELMRRLGEFLWVTHWDELAVPFYQGRDGYGRALNADLLCGPGEVLGAGERHTDAGQVRAALRIHGVDPSEYAWYIAMKSSFPLRTAGFGLGVERFLMWLLRHRDIRDLELLPRVNGQVILP